MQAIILVAMQMLC